jgi:hypothetical protein
MLIFPARAHNELLLAKSPRRSTPVEKLIMKTCPQCNAQYPNDYRFCLIDGVTLNEPDAEQETLVKNRMVFSIPSPAGLSLNCKACGIENSADSRFCKNCGAPLQESAAGNALPVGGVESQNPYPGQGESPRTAADPGRRSLLPVIAVVLLGSLIIAAAILYSSQPGPSGQESGGNVNKSPKNSATSTPTPTPTPTPAPKSPTPANTGTPADVMGQTGRLTTNQRIRAASNMYSEIIGVHYQGAQVEVLEETSYDTEEGPSTWYRVRVIKNGCDREGKMGCGNDLDGKRGKAAMEGWMNARHIALD